MSPKPRNILLIALGALLLTVLTVVGGNYAIKTAAQNRAMGEYLTPYGEEAVAYLAENDAFAAEYGDVTLNVSNYSYGYLDPKKYTGVSLNPRIPATAEDFAAELAYLTVSVRFSGIHAVNVRFEPSPEGGLEITGWENADE